MHGSARMHHRSGAIYTIAFLAHKRSQHLFLTSNSDGSYDLLSRQRKGIGSQMLLRHAYDDALYAKCGSGADGVLVCSGTL